MAVAHSLLQDQCRELADLPIRPGGEGWDCVLYRLGDDLAIRLPRRTMAAPLLEHEQRWLPTLATALPIPIPAPIHSGTRTAEFPWPWSIVPWYEGTTAVHGELNGATEAARLGSFLRRLHSLPVTAEAPRNPYRGGPLQDRHDIDMERLDYASRDLEPSLVAAAHEVIATASGALSTQTESWIHGDLHGKNVIVRAGVITAIIDWIDVCRGDPATDLAAAWILFAPSQQLTFWDAYGDPAEELQIRARAWAIAFGLMLYDSHNVTDPLFAEYAVAAIRRAAVGGASASPATG